MDSTDDTGADALGATLRELNGLAEGFGRAMTTAFKRSVVDGRQLQDVLRGLALELSGRALSAALAPIGKGIGGLIGSSLGGLAGAAASAGGLRGAAGPPGGPRSPAPPPGRSPAVAPQRIVNVTFNVKARDAESFRRAEAEVTAMLARAVARGQRGM